MTKKQPPFISSKNHVVFELNGYLVYSRLIEGEFHPYKSAIPTTCTTEVIVDRKELIAALERSLILISDRTPSPARCYFENNSIKNKLLNKRWKDNRRDKG